MTASLRIRHATQAAKPGRSGEPLRAVLFEAETSLDLSASKRMGNFARNINACNMNTLECCEVLLV